MESSESTSLPMSSTNSLCSSVVCCISSPKLTTYFAHLSENSSRHRKTLFHVTNSSHLFHPEGPTALGWNKENRIDGVEEGVSWLRIEIYRHQTISITFWYWVGSSVLCCYIHWVLQAFAVSVFVPLVIGRDFNLARNIFESLHLRLKHNSLYYL